MVKWHCYTFSPDLQLIVSLYALCRVTELGRRNYGVWIFPLDNVKLQNKTMHNKLCLKFASGFIIIAFDEYVLLPNVNRKVLVVDVCRNIADKA